MTITQNIRSLVDQGFFSEIDFHFAKFMTELSDEPSQELFLAAALVSRATGQGHVCLDLPTVAGQPLVADDSDSAVFVCPQLSHWLGKLSEKSVIGAPGDYRPLILDDRSRLYLYRYWEYEKTLTDAIIARAREEKELDSPTLPEGLNRLFPDKQEEVNWQKIAAFAAASKSFCVISGGPGTGKTTAIARILALLLELNGLEKIRLALVAPTGKAASRLQEAVRKAKETLPVESRIKEAIVSEAGTIHRLLGTRLGSPYFVHNAQNPLPVSVVVVDEASMVDLALMSKLFQALPRSARVILIGDRDQLASVEAGAVLGDICDRGRIHGFSRGFRARYQQFTGEKIHAQSARIERSPLRDCVVQLQKNYRFGSESGIGALSRAVNEGDGEQALTLLKGADYDDIEWQELPSPSGLKNILRARILDSYKPYLLERDPREAFALFGRFRLLCALRRGPYGVSTLNLMVERILKDEALIDPERHWYRGRPVLITGNDYNLGLYNGDTGIVLPDPEAGDELRAFFLSPNGELRKVLPVRLADHETAYAMTVHKSQGSEFNSPLFLLPDKPSPVLTRELLYTGITRAIESVEVWGSEAVFVEAVSRRIERTSGLRDALWE